MLSGRCLCDELFTRLDESHRLWCFVVCDRKDPIMARFGLQRHRKKVCILTYLITYLLTPWCRVLLEKLTGLQLVKKFPAFYGTRMFITTLTSVRHPSLSWASPIQSIHPHPTSWRSVLILFTHLRLGLPSGLFPSGFPTKNLYTPSPHPYAPHAQPISFLKKVCIYMYICNLYFTFLL